MSHIAVGLRARSAQENYVLAVRAAQLAARRAATPPRVSNMANGVADVSVPFPEDWMQKLREVSPVSETTSWLLPYYYRAAERWVLYDALPARLIPDTDDVALGNLITGADFHKIMNGPRPSEREDHKDVSVWPISDVQHEMYRLHKVYARPFWVLQGDAGGHQVAFTPQQAAYLVAIGKPDRPPTIGSLPACPLDNRVLSQLHALNRLHQMEDSIERLRKSGSREWADAEQARMDRDIRQAEMQFIEAQMSPVVDMAMSLVRGSNTRSEHRDQIVDVTPGIAARAKDAYARYAETGDYDPDLKDFTGIPKR